MARDHYMPAAFIGRFSKDSDLPMRQREVWVFGQHRKTVRSEKSENIGFRNNYYRIRGGAQDGVPVEKVWDKYESRLTEALNELVDPAVQSVSAELWLRVLVPFVSGIFVRTPDFVRKYEGKSRMINPFDDEPDWMRNNTNMSRLIAMQRSLAPIMAAKWIVAHTSGAEPLITNDLGYVNNQFSTQQSAAGWTIPLGPRIALQLMHCLDGRGRPVLFYTGKEAGWRAFTDHMTLATNSQAGLNQSLSQFANEFIIGESHELVARYASKIGEFADQATFNPQIRTSHRMQIVHEREWNRLVTAIKYEPSDKNLSKFEIDWGEVSRDWHPGIALMPSNLPNFTTGLRLRGRTITLGMTEVPGFTDYSMDTFPWEVEAPGVARVELE